MPNVIFITGSKGGVGATTCACYIASALSSMGERTLVCDGDFDCSDALTVCGMNGLNVYTLADAQRGACRVRQAILQHRKKPNLYLLPTQGCYDEAYISESVAKAAATFDYVLCDSCARAACNSAIVVSEPYPSAIKAADKKISKLKDSGIRDIGLVLNKVNGGLVYEGAIPPPKKIAELLRCELRGVIPEDLTLTVGKSNVCTQKAFNLTASYIAGKGKKIYSSARRYGGLFGVAKRKLRSMV